MFMKSATSSTSFSFSASTIPRVICGSCRSGDWLPHTACTSICDSSMHSITGLSLFSPSAEARMSTMACTSLTECSSIDYKSDFKSIGRVLRLKWHCNNILAITVGSS